MTPLSDRKKVVFVIHEAHTAGARLKPACEIAGIHVRTYYNWVKEGEVTVDRRPDAKRPEPVRKLSQAEREQILYWVNQPQYQSQTPAYIVADLMDKEGLYIASESTFYRVMKEAKMIKKHLWGIINAIVLNASNGHAESTNSKIKMIKVKSRGFRCKERFKTAIYFHLGGLNLYPDGVK